MKNRILTFDEFINEESKTNIYYVFVDSYVNNPKDIISKIKNLNNNNIVGYKILKPGYSGYDGCHIKIFMNGYLEQRIVSETIENLCKVLGYKSCDAIMSTIKKVKIDKKDFLKL